jgi:hypothetical protein
MLADRAGMTTTFLSELVWMATMRKGKNPGPVAVRTCYRRARNIFVLCDSQAWLAGFAGLRKGVERKGGRGRAI